MRAWIHGWVLLLWSCAAVAAGTVVDGEFDSTALGVTKAYKVYLPEAYRDGTRRFPVIYLLHGWGVTEEAWTRPGLDVASTADAMGLQAIIAMPDGDRGLYVNSATPPDFDKCLRDAPVRNKAEPRSTFCVRHSKYEDYFTRDFIGHLDRKFRTIPERRARALTGESAGGYSAMQLALRHPELFSSAASHSGFLSLLYAGPRPYAKGSVVERTSIAATESGLEELVTLFGTDLQRWREHDPVSLVRTRQVREVAIYIDSGADDEPGFADHTMYFRDVLLELGIPHVFALPPGRHNEELWRVQVRESLEFHVCAFERQGIPMQSARCGK